VGDPPKSVKAFRSRAEELNLSRAAIDGAAGCPRASEPVGERAKPGLSTWPCELVLSCSRPNRLLFGGDHNAEGAALAGIDVGLADECAALREFGSRSDEWRSWPIRRAIRAARRVFLNRAYEIHTSQATADRFGGPGDGLAHAVLSFSAALAAK
jgi:hypothetical protein